MFMIVCSDRMLTSKLAAYSLRLYYIMNIRHVHDRLLRSHAYKQACSMLTTLILYHKAPYSYSLSAYTVKEFNKDKNIIITVLFMF